jgi:hypothetical protein
MIRPSIEISNWSIVVDCSAVALSSAKTWPVGVISTQAGTSGGESGELQAPKARLKGIRDRA